MNPAKTSNEKIKKKNLKSQRKSPSSKASRSRADKDEDWDQIFYDTNKAHEDQEEKVSNLSDW